MVLAAGALASTHARGLRRLGCGSGISAEPSLYASPLFNNRKMAKNNRGVGLGLFWTFFRH
jgi:hypothetical protein